jgi:hypothetical protein
MWQKVAAGAVLGAAATKLLLSARADTPNSSRPSYTAPSVTFAPGELHPTAASLRMLCWR